MKITVDINAAILPDQGLGGFALRSNITDFTRYLSHNTELAKSSQLMYPFEARYTLGGGIVSVCVDVRNGKIFKLIAHEGYKGLLFGKIAVGTSVREVFQLDSNFEYSEMDADIIHTVVKGVVLDTVEDDPWPEEVMDMDIGSISVFAPESIYAEGGW